MDNILWWSSDATDGYNVCKGRLERYGYGTKTDYESAAKSSLGKQDGVGKIMTVEDDYIAGTDPTNVASVFTTYISMTNDQPYVTWKPDLNEGGAKSLRTYKICGKETLDGDGEWEYPTNSLHHFFKVSVEMP